MFQYSTAQEKESEGCGSAGGGGGRCTSTQSGHRLPKPLTNHCDLSIPTTQRRRGDMAFFSPHAPPRRCCSQGATPRARSHQPLRLAPCALRSAPNQISIPAHTYTHTSRSATHKRRLRNTCMKHKNMLKYILYCWRQRATKVTVSINPRWCDAPPPPPSMRTAGPVSVGRVSTYRPRPQTPSDCTNGYIRRVMQVPLQAAAALCIPACSP